MERFFAFRQLLCFPLIQQPEELRHTRANEKKKTHFG
jgi:hypothetical protein